MIRALKELYFDAFKCSYSFIPINYSVDQVNIARNNSNDTKCVTKMNARVV